MKFSSYILVSGGVLFSLSSWWSESENDKRGYKLFPKLSQVTYSVGAPPDSIRKDSSLRDTLKKGKRGLSFYKRDRYGDPFTDRPGRSPLELKDPSNVKTDVSVDTAGNVTIAETVGPVPYRPSTTLTYKEFSEYSDRKLAADYWRSKTEAAGGKSEMTGRKLIPKIYISPVFDRIFGGNYIDFQTNGFVTLDFGAQWQRVQNPNLPIRQQRYFLPLNMDQQINLNFTGKVGEKLKITGAFDTKASFQFEQNFKLDYTGYDHEIIQKVEAGNVSMPLNSTLIQGVQNLFGLKTQLQFGKLKVTGILANQRAKVSETTLQGGGVQNKKFEFKVSEYEDNRHFFLGHFFRDKYETALSTLPIISSGVQITRLEVYVTNRNNTTETLRNMVAFLDLGDPSPYRKDNPVLQPFTGTGPIRNTANNLYTALNTGNVRNVDQVSNQLATLGLQKGSDFEILRSARKLAQSEYSFNSQLGYVSLNTALRNDEVLGVAFEYTYQGQSYKVGELTEDYSTRDQNEVLFLKMLRPSTIKLDLPTWDLMMKNIYSLGAGQLNRDGFQLRVIYKDDLTGIDNPSLQQGANTKDVPLLQVFNLDKLNPQGDAQADGNFDWVEGVTVNSQYGRIIFPVLEPFSSDYLTKSRRQGARTLPPWLDPVSELALVNKYSFNTLYSSTKQEAQQVAAKNKFFIKGSYQTSGATNQVALGMVGVDANSVVVTAGGRTLVQGQDYIVENGNVTILNEGILLSGQEIQIRSEQADLFQNQVRTVTGARLEYVFTKDFSIGATLMRMRERPLLRRVSMGNEPLNNTILGFDVNFRKESRFLTRMVDKLPFLSTKELSNITFNGEFAKLFPGVAPLVQGNSYVDDFEGSETSFLLTRSPQIYWRLGATPLMFPDANVGTNALPYSYHRAKLAWYTIDNTFYRDNLPGGISEGQINNHYVRVVVPTEVFPQQAQQQIITNLQTMDVAYYPQERGMYNYNPNLDAQGRFRDNSKDALKKNWAAISRGITYDVDFDNANVQYIEFWMMDPFIESDRGVINDGFTTFRGDQREGGDIYFNLGNVSEDVMKDGKHNFENGLPISATDDQRPVTESVWGKAPSSSWINNAFDNTSGARQRQDIGLDGLTTEEEKAFFNSGQEDPSADDFAHPLDPKFDSEGNLLVRHKNFNGYENNSPDATGQDFSRAATTLPDNEDLNNDQTINDIESYYQYKIHVSRDQMQVGQNHIVAINESSESGEAVKWYQFRIPVREYTDKVGDIEGFKSIRFMRMFLTNFAQPHVFRMANFQLVANQWRVYTDNLYDKDLQLPSEPYDANFTLGTVNIEENSSVGNGNLFPYKIPPNLPRDRDITTLNNRQLNEQSLRLCVDDLRDRDARAVYKNVSLDFINYKNLKLYIHAESDNDQTLRSADSLRAFVRLGTDYTDNYYEIEVPLMFSTAGDTATANIWPDWNQINLPYAKLAEIKSNRNRRGQSVLVPYSEFLQDQTISGKRYRITVVGNPDYSAIQVLMLGMRNARSLDMQPKKACIWLDELRSEGFNQQGGFAATARMNVKLADFANITAAGDIETFGFGGIQQRIAERARQNTMHYSIGANVNLEKLFPQWLGIKIPMFVGYERERIKPRYNPLDPDVPLDMSIESRFANKSEAEADEYRKMVEDNTTRRSINFTNVQKIKPAGVTKSHVWDLSNFSFNYSYSDITRTNITTALYYQKNVRGGIGYVFNTTPNYFEPFKNSKALDKPAWKWLKDFNLNLIPSNIAIRGDLNRMFTKTQYRNADPSALGTGLTTVGVKPLYEKSFTFNRSYDVLWNFTRNLSFNYSAIANAVIDEPDGDINDTELRPGFSKRDSVVYNLKRFGRMKNFQQHATATYRMPLDKFPITNWVSADVRYATAYNWRASALGVADTLGLFFGNYADNSRQRAINGRIDLLKLYNKLPFLKKINEPARRPTARPAARPTPGQPGAPVAVQRDTVKRPPQFKFFKGIVRTLMTARNVNFSYTIDETTSLPGFMPHARFLGLDSSLLAPGLGFTLLGSQDAGIRQKAAKNGWLTQSTQLNTPFMQTLAKNFTAQADLEPFRDFKIRLNVKKTQTQEYSEMFRDVNPSLTESDYESQNAVKSGTYSISFISIKTAFQDNRSTFEEFEKNAGIMKNRFGERVTGAGKYDTTSQDVLIPAFIATYSGKSLNKAKLTSFPKIPLPNWNITYAGLSKLEVFKNIFSSINITHGYSSTYTIGSYRSPQEYASSGLIGLNSSLDALGYVPNVNNDSVYIPLLITDRVTITERFSPLIGIDLRTPSKLTARITYNKERTISLITTSRQVSEITNQDVTVSVGYTKNNLKLPFRVQGEQRVLKNDVQFRCDVRFLDSKTIQRRFQGVNTPVAGNFQVSVKPTIQYAINQRVNITVYFERNVNRPVVSTSYPRSDTRFGFRMQYNLSQ
ncbi:cell surface protein SprA [Cytophagaceae bacterium YF14B1]|uniref:Cell surface protein SprA n=1 Tax=Xanthocytophaga flava TaxID=3048013 RepID=A0AAE3QXA4_9BACT|nr:cell surface protein SprA [Xanthocytophaga flavus]MDJ1484916.1 cell surface protein SprA [Xanthocytophaga flavus]